MDEVPVGEHEQLGRVCFDRDQAGRKNPRTRFIERAFVDGEMSVDRLDSADIQCVTRLHIQEGEGRNPPRTFHGWYVFTVGIVLSVGWVVKPEKTPSNPWHAEVVCNLSVDEADAHLQHCGKIASLARWKDRPMGRGDEEFFDRLLDNLE